MDNIAQNHSETAQRCPHCGFCPTCGRSNPTGWYYPYITYPQPAVYPWWGQYQGTYTATGGTTDNMSVSHLNAGSVISVNS